MNTRNILTGLVALTAFTTPMLASAATAKPAAVQHHKKVVKTAKTKDAKTAATPAAK
jgi:hypothetical protein